MSHQKEWEKQFDKEFKWFHRPDSIQIKAIDTFSMAAELKAFITTLLAEERRQGINEGSKGVADLCEMAKRQGENSERKRVVEKIKEIHQELHDGNSAKAYLLVEALLAINNEERK